MKKIIILLGFLVFLFLSGEPETLFAETTVKDVELNLMCMCEDKCGKMLSNCSCKFSDEMRTTISGKLKDGLTKDEILAFYIGKYGERVLAAPTKRGFNLIAWVTPFVLLLGGGVAIRRLIRKWVQTSKKEHALEKQEKDGKKVEKKYLDQLRDELKEFDV